MNYGTLILIILLPAGVLILFYALSKIREQDVLDRYVQWVMNQGGTVKSINKQYSWWLRTNRYTCQWIDSCGKMHTKSFDPVTADFEELCEKENSPNHGLESTGAPPTAGSPETHP